MAPKPAANPAPKKAASKLGTGGKLPTGNDRTIKTDAAVALLAFSFDAVPGPANRLHDYREASVVLDGMFENVKKMSGTSESDSFKAFKSIVDDSKIFTKKMDALKATLSAVQAGKFWVESNPKTRDIKEVILLIDALRGTAGGLAGLASL